jgi:hypothetical protein
LFMVCSNIKLTRPAMSIRIRAGSALRRFMNRIKGIQ